jgi:hypothetical protein
MDDAEIPDPILYFKVRMCGRSRVHFRINYSMHAQRFPVFSIGNDTYTSSQIQFKSFDLIVTSTF